MDLRGGRCQLAGMPASAIDLRDKKALRFKGYQVHMFEVVYAPKIACGCAATRSKGSFGN